FAGTVGGGHAALEVGAFGHILADRFLQRHDRDGVDIGLHAVYVGDVLGDLLQAVRALAGDDRLAEIILVAFGFDRIIRDHARVAFPAHDLDLQQFGRSDAGDDLG